MSKLPYRAPVLFAAALLAAACANTGTATSEREDMLAEAGFALKKANTPQRIATLKALPPHRFVQRGTGGGAKYFYGDPTLCGCIYVGDQNAYNQYRQQMAARQTATDAQIRAILSTAPLAGEEGLL